MRIVAKRRRMSTYAMANAKQSQWVLVLIGIGKLLKVAILLLLAFKLHSLLKPDAADTLKAWVRHIRVDPDNHFIHSLIARATGISHQQLRELRVGSFVYAGLYAVEGTGLVLRQRWAEYFTTITTGLLLPLEVYEILHGHRHMLKIIVFLLNAAVMAYLVMQLRTGRGIRSDAEHIARRPH